MAPEKLHSCVSCAVFFSASVGTVKICDIDIAKKTLTAQRHIGYLPEVPPLYPQMTVSEYLKFAAKLKDLPHRSIKFQLEKTLEECRLDNVRGKIIAHLSLGYKQRVGIAQAIIHDPDILILDEPTKGLDPIQVQQVRALISGLREKRTVILSTHVLSEIEQTSQRVLIIKDGTIITDESLEHLLEQHEGSLDKAFFVLNGVEEDS